MAGSSSSRIPSQFVAHDDEPSRSFGDHQPGEEWTTDQLAALTGGTVFSVDYPTLVRTDGDRAARVPVLATDSTQLPDSGLALLVSGRWPAAEDEIAVTESGVAAGLPTGGSVTLRGRSEEADHPVVVVGVVTATDPERRPVFAVVDDAVRAWNPQGSGLASGFLLERAEPVTWADVQAWNAYGLVVFSAAVALDPPPAGEQSAQLRQQARDNSATVVGLMALIGIGLLLETTLLAGPAFAVSAARQRRSLALIASNGAERAQLRRYVLGQALLLGGLAALLGVPLGLAGGVGLIGLERRIEPSASVGPFDPPWIWLCGLVLVAVLSSVVAALLPARGAAKIKIADVLAGRERSQPVRARMPLLALLLMLGAAGMLVARLLVWPNTYFGPPDVLATMVLVLAGLPMIGSLLVLLGRVVGRLRLPLRLPIRDAARQRSRSGSAIAAVMVTVATMTILVVTNVSDDQQGRRDYQTDQIVGRGYVYDDFGGAEAVRNQIAAEHPDWKILRLDRVGPESRQEGTGRVPSLAVRPRGCTAVESITRARGSRERLLPAGNGRGGTGLSRPPGVVRPTALPRSRPGETAACWSAIPDFLSTGRCGSSSGRSSSPTPTRSGSNARSRVPGAVVSAEQLRTVLRQSSHNRWTEAGGALSVESVERLGLPSQLERLELIDPDGPISRADERAINGGAASGPLLVERGYVSQDQALIWVLLGVAAALVLVAALVATALAQAEGQADLATLTALGGTLGLRRRLVAGQAAVIAGLGAALGLLLGLLPGSAVAMSLTYLSDSTGDVVGGLVVIPWLRLALVVIGVPAIAALVAALARPAGADTHPTPHLRHQQGERICGDYGRIFCST